MRVHGATAKAVGSKKGNEDAWSLHIASSGTTGVAVADGVTYLPEPGEAYPTGHPGQVAMRVAQTTAQFLGESSGSRSSEAVCMAFQVAGRWVDRYNLEYGFRPRLTTRTFRSSQAATLVAAWLWGDLSGGTRGFVGSVGDGVILKVGVHSSTLLSRDQLKRVHAYAWTRSWQTNEERWRFQRDVAKNAPLAVDDAGRSIGYGVIDGNARALAFLDIRAVELAYGERLVLASDAIRVCSDAADPDDDLGYAAVAELVRSEPDNANVPDVLIRYIRECEEKKGGRSDDATVVSIEG